jgi:hypothetical protein
MMKIPIITLELPNGPDEAAQQKVYRRALLTAIEYPK